MTQRRRILVTSALYYANGPLHLGHVLEAIQTDIWVRFQKLRGHECYYVCADDTHGTPIMLKAQSEGITPEELIQRVHIEHTRDLEEMLIGLDNFGSTHSTENEAVCDRMYRALRAADYIDRRTIRQAYDDTAKMFLPDRYVKGTCPVCGTADQYGDSCENCGSTYTPADLKNPALRGDGHGSRVARIGALFLSPERIRTAPRRLGEERLRAGQRRAQTR